MPSPSSRPASRATIGSLSSFTFQPISSPSLREASEATTNPQILESLDPSFLSQLNNLQANQIDDLENALLPHLQSEPGSSNTGQQQPTALTFKRQKERSSNFATTVNDDNQFDSVVDNTFNTSATNAAAASAEDNVNVNGAQALNIPKQELLPLLDEHQTVRPNGSSTPKRKQLNITLSSANNDATPGTPGAATFDPLPSTSLASGGPPDLNLSHSQEDDSRGDHTVDDALPQLPIESTCLEPLESYELNPGTSPAPVMAEEEISPTTANSVKESEQQQQPVTTATQNANQDQVLVVDEETNQDAEVDAADSVQSPDNSQDQDVSGSNQVDTEFKIPLSNDGDVQKDQSFTFNIPGSSKSVTLNFSAEALTKLRTAAMARQDPDAAVTSGSEVVQDQNVVSTTETSVKKQSSKKSHFNCGMCSKSFPSQRLLAKHQKYHLVQNTSCKECGAVFAKKWQLDQHLAIEHDQDGQGGPPLQCKECGKQFKWHRNLLAHIQLAHQTEIRFRCKNCPLTFLRKKLFIKHHRDKHGDKTEPWCNLCLEVFTGRKQREDHTCERVENNGRNIICHMHDTPIEFNRMADLEEHLNSAHPKDDSTKNLLKSCLVCHKVTPT